MRILMAAAVPKRREGGVATMLYNLGRGLQQRGHELTYLFAEDLPGSRNVPQRFADSAFALRLAAYIRRNRLRFSIVNIHAPAGFFYGWLRHISSRAHLPPYVMTLHGLEERRIHAMSREVKKGRAWHYSWRNRFWHRFYLFPRFRWSIRTADGAHCVARDVWTMLHLKYNLDADRVACIPNGVEPRFYLPREYGHDGQVRLLYAGTWLDQRGIFYIREALQQIGGRLPGMSITFAGLGVPEGDVYSFFGEGLRQRIRVLPVIPWDQMPALYAEHDIFVFPSLMEGLPSVLLEAMASGMAVITTETCGMPDVVQDGVTGVLIPPADAEALTCAILRLGGSVERRKEIGEAARKSMRRYTWEAAAQRLEEFFVRIIESEAARD